jgi:hypothetical protein
MDLITALPATPDGFDAILAVVDRFTKMIHPIPTTTTVTATKLAQLFLDRIVVHHGFPTSIVSDRDLRFNSHFLACPILLLWFPLSHVNSLSPQNIWSDKTSQPHS